jgi:hypothetical protein
MSEWTYNESEFKNTLGLIAELSRRSLSEVIEQQAKLFTQDASSFTPPFGTAPIKESASEKKRIGEGAVAMDIERAFYPIQDLRVYHTNTEMGEALRRAAKQKNTLLTEHLLKKALKGRRFAGVLEKPEPERHKSMRNRRGRVPKVASYFTLGGDSLRKRYIRQTQKKVGLAKAGWTMALRALQGKVPSFVSRQTMATGIFRAALTGTTPSITVGNSVPHAQDSAARIEQQAWNNRMRNSQKQLEALERAARKKMRELRIEA